MKNEELDIFITRSLEKGELEVPVPLQDGVRERVASEPMRPRPASCKASAFRASLAAAALLLAVVAISRLFPPRPPEKKITQIRTEFSIPGKNIKIIWVQRNDFHMPDNNG